MRLRSFTAPTVAEAMRQVRTALGEDAVILATEEQGRSVRITAAIDPHPAAGVRPASAHQAASAPPVANETVDLVAAALRYHGMPQPLLERLVTLASAYEIGDPQQALNAAFRARFDFLPLTEALPAKPIVLAGLPGAGKSSTLAKLAARAKVNGWAATAITCDLAKAGAVEQLATYAKALEIPAYRAKDKATLQRAVTRAEAKGMILVDTIGTNPLVPDDLAELRDLVAAISGELVLVMAAGGDVSESAELAAAYAEAGAKRLIATKVDLTRRYGGILAAAEAGRLAFAGFGISPQIASGLAAPRPDRLARLFLPAAEGGNGPTPPERGNNAEAGAPKPAGSGKQAQPTTNKPDTGQHRTLRGAAS